MHKDLPNRAHVFGWTGIVYYALKKLEVFRRKEKCFRSHSSACNRVEGGSPQWTKLFHQVCRRRGWFLFSIDLGATFCYSGRVICARYRFREWHFWDNYLHVLFEENLWLYCPWMWQFKFKTLYLGPSLFEKVHCMINHADALKAP